MDGKQLIDALKKKLGTPTDEALAERLGIARAALSQWRDTGPTYNQLSNTIAKALSRSAESAIEASIKPIVEYYPITVVKNRRRWDVFKPENGEKQRKDIQQRLSEAHGIYVFYDSQGKALYVGKTEGKSQKLWARMKASFNEDKKIKIQRVSHGAINRKYDFKKKRSVQPEPVRLRQLAFYFSAYKVAPDLIHNAEALLVRAFANGLLNSDKPKFMR